MENDGFDLGPQRRPIDENDFPRVREAIAAYLQGLRKGAGESAPRKEPTALAAESRAEYVVEGSQSERGSTAEKERLAADGEYN